MYGVFRVGYSIGLQRNIIIYPVSDHLRGVSVVCIVIYS